MSHPSAGHGREHNVSKPSWTGKADAGVSPAADRRSPDRRKPARMVLVVLVAGLLVAATVIAVGFGVLSQSAPGTCSTSWNPAPRTQTPIQHLFILIKENHAFENYFGNLPGVIGYPPNGSFPVAFNSTRYVHPFPLTGVSTPDLPHTSQANLVDLNGGANNLFVAEANASGAASPQDAVGYYSAQQIPDYYQYAHYYALGDRFFTGVLGPTDPNRVFDLSAYVDGWNADSTPPAYVTSQPTVLDQLTTAGISWSYDYAGVPVTLTPDLFPSIRDSSCNAPRIVPTSELASQLVSSPVPSVVYIDPSASPQYSEHPPANVTLGENWTVAVINSILKSPVANSSAILIFYDENGGYWDPLVPPMTSTGSDGFRVPLLVISPWTPAGTICSQQLDPASVLHFVDSNWGLRFLNARVAAAPNLGGFFNFSASPRPPLLLATDVSLTSSSPGASPVAPASNLQLKQSVPRRTILTSGDQAAALSQLAPSTPPNLRRRRSPPPRPWSCRPMPTPAGWLAARPVGSRCVVQTSAAGALGGRSPLGRRAAQRPRRRAGAQGCPYHGRGHPQQPEDVTIGVGELRHPTPLFFLERLRKGDPGSLHRVDLALDLIRDECDARVPRIYGLEALAEVENEPISGRCHQHRMSRARQGVYCEAHLLLPPRGGGFRVGDDHCDIRDRNHCQVVTRSGDISALGRPLCAMGELCGFASGRGPADPVPERGTRIEHGVDASGEGASLPSCGRVRGPEHPLRRGRWPGRE